MKKLTAEKCRYLRDEIKAGEWGISIREELYLQALEIALPILEQQETEGATNDRKV